MILLFTGGQPRPEDTFVRHRGVVASRCGECRELDERIGTLKCHVADERANHLTVQNSVCLTYENILTLELLHLSELENNVLD